MYHPGYSSAGRRDAVEADGGIEKMDHKHFATLKLLSKHEKHMKDLSYMGEGGLSPATSSQRRYIHQLLGLLGYDESDYPRFEEKDMTLAEASELIEDLKFELDGRKPFGYL